MKPYKNFYVKTLIRVLKNNKAYNNKVKSNLLIQFDKVFNKKHCIFPTKLFRSYIDNNINIKTYYNITTQYRLLIVNRLIDDINSIVGEEKRLAKDKETLKKIINNDIESILEDKLNVREFICFSLKANEIFYRYDDINDNKE